MTIEEDVDGALSLHESCKRIKIEQPSHLKRWHWMVLCLVCISLGAVLLLPAIDKRWSESFFVAKEKTVPSLGDTNDSAYNYWYAPPNSMGIKETKTVNWSYFRSLFLTHIDWMLEYKRYESSSWTDGSDYLTIDRTWNDSGFWKFNLILDVPVDVYSARFTFGCNLSVLQYVEREGYEVWINYTANATEIYSVMFNWSDITNIPGLIITKGVQGDMFWFRFRRDNIPSGYYEFDPTFGGNIAAPTQTSMDGRMWYLQASVAEAGNIVIDNMTFTYQANAVHDMRVGIYNATGVLKAQSVEFQTLGTGIKYTKTLNMDDAYTIPGTGTYHLVLTSEDNGVDNYCFRNAAGSLSIDYVNYVYNQGANLPNPEPAHGAWWDTSADLAIYASYHAVSSEAWQDVGSMDFNVSFSNTTVNRDIGSMNFNISFSNTTTYTDVGNMNFNVSFGNTTIYRDVGSMDFNISFSNSSAARVWQDIGDMNFNVSFGNNTIYRDIGNMDFNVSFSNSSVRAWLDIGSMDFNVSFGNTTVNRNVGSMNFNVSFSNTTVHRDIGNMNFNVSFGNTSVRTWQDIGSMFFNISFSNTTIYEDIGGMDFNVSFSNSTAALAWYPIGNMYFNVSFGNVSTIIYITEEYPDNDSRIQIVQPSLYFNLTNPTGKLMNYSIYIGNSSANTSMLLYNTTDVGNGTQFSSSHIYYSATEYYEGYHWRVEVNAGGQWINETYNFQAILQEDTIITTPGFDIFMLLGAVAVSILLLKRRKK